MNAQEFATTVRKVVMDAAVNDTVSSLEQPPGRRPASELVALSSWYLALGPTDQDMVRRALATVSYAAVFGLFAVLDGVRRIDEAQPAGELELWYERLGGRQLLSGGLHDLLNSES
jgi:hypothetical protein